jgi:PPOX class probable F420-dependent enzyme
MAELTDKARTLIDDPNFAYLATVSKDGGPQVTPVWIDRDGDTIRINTAKGRAKDRNMRRDPRVAVSIAATDDPYERVEIRGHVVGTVDEPDARAHIDGLHRKYHDTDDAYPKRAGEERVVFLIEPDRIH